MTNFKLLYFYCVICFILMKLHSGYCKENDDEDDDPYTSTDPKKREPSPCEICKFFVTELTSRLDLSSKSKEVIETGHGLDKKKRFKYLTSELRLTEALHEPHICEKILEYNVHAERKGSLRYAKGMSETMSTLHGLVNKGVKVELGIPYELWDKPSAEVSKMHRACFTFAEKYEETIEEWYYNLQEKENLLNYLCEKRFLKGKDQNCLKEVFQPKGDGENDDDTSKEKRKKRKKAKKTENKDDVSDPSSSTTPPTENNDVTPPPPPQEAADPEIIPTPPTPTTPTPKDQHTEL